MVNRTRGQLILTAAILVALTIVASAILLNSIHASADVKSMQERQGLEEAERAIEQRSADLDQLLLNNGSKERLPYIEPGEEDTFAAAIEEYNEQYLNLSTKEGTALVNVTLLDTEDTGNATWQNSSEDSNEKYKKFPEKPIIDDSSPIENITYMQYTVTDIPSGGSFNVTIGGGQSELNITADDIFVDGESVCSGFDANETKPLVLEFSHGDGTITDGAEHCVSVSFDSSYYTSSKTVEFTRDGEVEGEFGIVVEGGHIAFSASEEYQGKSEDVLINPTIEVTYQDSQVTYSGNVTAFGGGS